MQYVPACIVIIIISREFAVTGLRLVLAGTGEVVAANQLGKIKTWTQIIAIAAYLLHDVPLNLIHIPVADIFIWIALILLLFQDGIISGKIELLL